MRSPHSQQQHLLRCCQTLQALTEVTNDYADKVLLGSSRISGVESIVCTRVGVSMVEGD